MRCVVHENKVIYELVSFPQPVILLIIQNHFVSNNIQETEMKVMYGGDHLLYCDLTNKTRSMPLNKFPNVQ